MNEVAPTRGCHSIIRHWRRFMKWNNDEFYKFIMEALGRIPCDRSPRDQAGNLTSFGRRQAFWQAALDQPDRLREDLRDLTAATLIDTSLALAKAYLPEEAVVRSKFFIVLFGGSSAYAVGDLNGFDLLQLPRRLGGSIDTDSVLRTFAHEMHHTGVTSCHKKHMAGIRRPERLGLVARLANEGMPVFYINRTKERLAALELSPNATQQADARDWEGHLARLPELFATAERDIHRNLLGEVEDEEIMATWMAGSQGAAYVLGSEMFEVIEAHLGLAAALDVARDCRQLLVTYNRAAALANQAGGDQYLYDPDLARSVAEFTGR